MNILNLYKSLLLAVILVLIPVVANGTTVDPPIVKGRITDAETGEPIPYVNITFINTTLGTISDVDGKFTIVCARNSNVVKFSSIGYETLEYEIELGTDQEIEIKLKPKFNTLNEVTIKPKKIFYRNKNNPAVELIEKVIDNKSNNRSDQLDFYNYEKYEKIQFALSEITDKFMKRKAFKKFQFVFDNIDTTKIEGSKVLPIYQTETISDFYYRKSPKETKEIIKANKMVSFEGIMDNQGMANYLDNLYQDIDIYDNYIPFVTYSFLSPIANAAPTFYQFFIQDTSLINGDQCVHLFFTPRNKADMLFQGSLYVNIDKNYAVKKLEMTVHDGINLNWVKDVKIFQEFESENDNEWHLTADEISIDFGITEGSMGIFGQRIVTYKDYSENRQVSDSIFGGLSTVQLENADNKTEEYWVKNRHMPLSKSEQGTYIVTDSIQKIPVFKRTMNIAGLILAGYRDLGLFEIGPVNTFYSYNPVEGPRLRFGGRTTPKLSKKINFETYGAYGFKDKKVKYYGSATYSLTKNTIYEFPVKSIKLSVQNETMIPGKELDFIQEDNALLSIKRGVNNKLFGNKIVKIEHLNEFDNHFSYTLSYSYNRQSPLGKLYYNTNVYEPDPGGSSYLNVSEVGINLRFAPHEQFYQGKTYRRPIANKYPILQLQYNAGLKSLGNDYNYHKLSFVIFKQFKLGVLGYSDVVGEAGKIFGEVPFPLLKIHNANQTYAYKLASYNMMNFLEFVSDQHISVNIDHHFNGFLFNKVPLLNKLKLREVVAAKVVYGSIMDKNNPTNNPDLFKFPIDANGDPITFSFGAEPYVEVSAGIENIFKFIRVEVIKRLTYLDNPGVSELGVRARFRFDF